MRLKSACYRVIGTIWNPRWRLLRTDREDSVAIICLHGVHDQAMERFAAPPTSSVSVASFEANLRALARHHTVISLGEAVAMLAGQVRWRRGCAVLTFDDSLACTVQVAAPVLKRMQMTATVFLSTEAIETARPYWWLRLDYAWHSAKQTRGEVTLGKGKPMVLDRGSIESLRQLKSVLRRTPALERDAAVGSLEHQLEARLEDPPSQYPYATTVTWAQARQLVELGFDVGSHTVSHPNLALLGAEEARAEIVDSKRSIEEQTGVPCRHFCYPYGSFNSAVASVLSDVGYSAATSTLSPGANRSGQDLFALRRYSMPAAAWKLGYILSGFPRFLPHS